MKIKSLSLNNFTGFSNVTVNFDENITYLVGPNGSGKSTLGLNGIWFVMKGIAEKGNDVLIGERFRFIGDNAATTRGILKLYDEKIGEIVVKRTMTKSGTKLEFIAPEGYYLDQGWLNELFNLYMIAPMKFAQLSSKEQTIALGIDVSSFDKQLKELKEQYTEINAVYRSLMPGEEPIVTNKNTNIDLLRNQLDEAVNAVELYQRDYSACEKIANEMDVILQQIQYLTAKYDDLEKDLAKKFTAGTETPLEEFSKMGSILKKLKQAQWEIQDRYDNAAKDQHNIILHEKWVSDTKRKKEQAILLEKNKADQEGVIESKNEYLKNLKLPYKNLKIDDEGNLLMNDRPIKEPYFSSGELLTIIPKLMATRNPELKYIYIQHFDLLDQEKQDKIIKDLSADGYQIVIEKVGKTIDRDGNIIVLQDMTIVGQEPEEDPTDNDLDDLVI